MVHMVIEGFRTSGDPALAEIARTLATRWLNSLYKLYAASSLMYEKYNVSIDDVSAGGGGEYTVQTGFGWTNGVIMDFLDKFGDSLQPIRPPPAWWEILLVFMRKCVIAIEEYIQWMKRWQNDFRNDFKDRWY